MEETLYDYAETKPDGARFNLKSNTEPNVKHPPVLEQYGTLTREMGMLGESVAKLRIQLEPILGPDVPSPERNEKNGGSQTQSPLAESIRSDAANLVEIHDQLRAIMGRIEI